MSSTTAATSLVVWGELIDQLRHADPALDRRIVFERELWCSLKPELAREPALQNAVRRLQTRQALALLGLRSEDTHVNPRVPQVRRGLDSGDGHEADPRVLQLPNRFREHLPDRLVNAPHSVAHASYSIGLALKAAAPHCERPAEKAHGYDDDAGRDRRRGRPGVDGSPARAAACSQWRRCCAPPRRAAAGETASARGSRGGRRGARSRRLRLPHLLAERRDPRVARECKEEQPGGLQD